MLSIMIPTLNESESLPQLYQEICDTSQEHNIDLEMIFIDDGSTDTSWEIISKFAANDGRVSGIRFRRNFAKAAALTAGMRAARGSVIMMMDADLQDNPKEIPRFLEKLDEGYDVVNGWKERRLDPWHKVYPSKVFNWMVGKLTGLWLHDHNCGFKLFRKEVAAELRIYGELHRFIPVLADSRGFKVTEISVHHRERQHGHSKYGVRRFLRGFLDLLTVRFLTGYGQRPQHMLGAVGLICLLLGGLGLGYLALIWILTNLFGLGLGPIGNRPLLAYSIAATILGGQAISLGLLAELIVAYTGRHQDSYSIAERTESTAQNEQEIIV
ncbi:glycosyltransferase family 2 protein [Gimesia aquarii]|uniref:Undecaprenyl-phosphate 4-deoxy-4-formamido-L-arabinose transferase n=1 Tax=Gimesia aquarii TaxID=2527964 RepID=A0A517W2Z5_9PLAN|nr:glycosyltransferase family 2 protein [Gimesia aquarii]QDT99626.1 Undecaprenyl-phosphate 4-deoxy-4-formamido-L-arabinose transferase [Gimesia aquarii]